MYINWNFALMRKRDSNNMNARIGVKYLLSGGSHRCPAQRLRSVRDRICTDLVSTRITRNNGGRLREPLVPAI